VEFEFRPNCWVVCGMAEILTPRPAATVMTLRDGPQGFEVLMLRRNLTSDFVGGAYVFPGGGVDEADAGASAQRLALGVNDSVASRRLGLASGGLAYYVACLRELFEEAGLLIACNPDGEPRQFDDEPTIRRMAANRRSVNDGSLDFISMMDREQLHLDLRALEYAAHWVTPVGPPRRFDTRFFVALAPPGQVATHDAGETVADQWVRPVDALEAHARGELDMILPTIRNLEAIAAFESSHQVLDHVRSLKHIVRVEPRIVERDGEIVILMPGDEGFED
jgi:8-oxo-dGTP pyrophosphatase MutT (NUDIX family)